MTKITDSDIRFTKMHGIGNDYVYIDCTDRMVSDPAALSIAMSPRHTSVGSDGVILICPSEIADFKMRIFNADGSEARMCGNGSRCVGKYVYDHRLTDKTEITLETLSGVKHLTLHVNPANGKVDLVTVDMGAYSLDCHDIGATAETPTLVEQKIATSAGHLAMTAVSMGNPHGVIFLPELEDIEIGHIGPELENHPMWTDRANIEFAAVTDSHNIRMRVWERGSGETQACGTGACATAVAAVITGRAKSPVTVHLNGGDLMITVCPDRHVLMQGPAAEVFSGCYNPC